MGKNYRSIINVGCSLAVLVTNIVISLVLSPFIVENIGVEANGFIALANSFIVYANLFVAALNSMAARFITIEYISHDYKKANLYYNSVFWGNLIIVIMLLLPATIIIARLEYFVDIPKQILIDVKLLFGFIFFNFFLRTAAPNWDCGTYITNRLDRQYIPNMIMALFRCIFLFLTFSLFVPHVWYIGLVSSIITVILLLVNGYNTYKLTPELKIQFKNRICSLSAIKELIQPGLWNSISDVGNMLLSGLDLIICNLTIGATAMGILSLAKMLPNYMQELSSSVRNAFAPELTINYAKNNREDVLRDLNRAMKFTSLIMTIPFAGIIILGDAFFALWVPSQDAQLLQILSILSIFGYMFTSGIQILFNVFQTVNKVKPNSIAMIISGIISILITILLIFNTDLGIYAVAGVSTFISLIKNMIFTVPCAARYLGFKWYQFYRNVGISFFSSILLICVGFIIKPYLILSSWCGLILSAIIVGIVGLAINFIMLLNKNERAYLINKIINKFNKKKK